VFKNPRFVVLRNKKAPPQFAKLVLGFYSGAFWKRAVMAFSRQVVMVF
jgi:hypothetical protein